MSVLHNRCPFYPFSLCKQFGVEAVWEHPLNKDLDFWGVFHPRCKFPAVSCVWQLWGHNLPARHHGGWTQIHDQYKFFLISNMMIQLPQHNLETFPLIPLLLPGSRGWPPAHYDHPIHHQLLHQSDVFKLWLLTQMQPWEYSQSIHLSDN